MNFQVYQILNNVLDLFLNSVMKHDGETFHFVHYQERSELCRKWTLFYNEETEVITFSEGWNYDA